MSSGRSVGLPDACLPLDVPPVHPLADPVGVFPVVPIQQGDTPLFHELKRRLANAALEASDKGVVERAIRTLDTLSTSATSEKVRAAAARDLLRCFTAMSEPARGPAQRNTLNVVVTAADLVGKADRDTLRLAMEAVRAARLAARGAPPLTPGESPGTGGEGSAGTGAPGSRVSPLASVTGPQHDQPPGATGQPVTPGGQGSVVPADPMADMTLEAEAKARLARLRAAAGEPLPGTMGTGPATGCPW
jgi:hypothetical protein